jgi:hypothetical protein
VLVSLTRLFGPAGDPEGPGEEENAVASINSTSGTTWVRAAG